MLFLSDQIFFDIPVFMSVTPPSNTVVVYPTYQDYKITAARPNWTTPTSDLLYSGRAFSFQLGQKLYVNDILSSYNDSYNWLSYDNIRTLQSYDDLPTTIISNPQETLFSRVTVSYQNETYSKDVCLINLDKRLNHSPIISSIDWFQNNSILQSFNVLSQRTTVLPRIPKLNMEDSKFFVGGVFGLNAAWTSIIQTEQGDETRATSQVVILDKNKNVLSSRDNEFFTKTPVSSILIKGDLITNNTYTDGEYVALVHPSSNINPVILAQFDKCPSDYYLIWCDRTSGYQCQPFSKRSEMSEDIETFVISNAFDESRPMERTVTNRWELNSDWLTYNEHKTYESIFTSPYTYLYDVKYNQLTPVICTEKYWSEKCKSNTNKPFNLKITLTSHIKQNLLY